MLFTFLWFLFFVSKEKNLNESTVQYLLVYRSWHLNSKTIIFFSFQCLVSCCRPASNWIPYLEQHCGERYKGMIYPPKKTDSQISTVSGSRKPEWDLIDKIYDCIMWFFFKNRGKRFYLYVNRVGKCTYYFHDSVIFLTFKQECSIKMWIS